jgi:hypothetical protein
MGHPKGVGKLTSNFLHGKGMDVFWNYPVRYGYLITTRITKLFINPIDVVVNNGICIQSLSNNS